MSDVEFRVKRLEDDSKETRADLKAIMNTLAEIKGTMSGLATKSELGDVRVALGKLETRVEKLPSTGKVATYLAIAVALITIAVRWSDLITYFGGSAPAS